MNNSIVFIGSISLKENVFGGETIKNLYFLNYLKDNLGDRKLIVIDTYNWKKHFFKLLFKISFNILNPFRKKIILSAADAGAYYLLKLYRMLNFFKKDLYYFILGGILPAVILDNNYKISYYKNIKKMYCEVKKIEKEMGELGFNNVEYIPNWKKFSYVNSIIIKDYSKIKKLRVFTFSRINREKGTDLVFEVIKMLNINGVSFEVDFFGVVDEDYKADFQKQISEKEYFRYLNTIDLFDENNYKILSQYDLMLFPTYHDGEGFPGTIIDCFIAGVPVIASDWNHNSEIIENKKTGFLFEAKSPKCLYDVLNHVYNNKHILNVMRKNCVVEAQKYKIENLLSKFIKEIY